MSARSVGALVIGGDYRGLGVVRSLGRRGIPVWVLHDPDHPLAAASRYARHSSPWPPIGEERRLRVLLALARQKGLSGWVLIPTTDEVVAFIARHYDALAANYRLTTPPWHRLEWAHDKRRLYALADTVGVEHPWTAYPADREAVDALRRDFPLIIKPAVHQSPNRLSNDKAWRVDDRQALLARYDEAASLMPPDLIMLQELVPGAGASQFSFGGLCQDGIPVASVVARRVRQIPMDFGRLSTFVESVHEPAVEEQAGRLLAAARHTGLIEVEFMLDPTDGMLKVLDANPRVWGWHTLTQGGGPDFAFLLFLMALGERVRGQAAAAGLRWTRLDLDLAVATGEMLAGRLRPLDYLRPFAGHVESAIFSARDPLPGLVELGLMEWVALRSVISRLGRAAAPS